MKIKDQILKNSKGQSLIQVVIALGMVGMLTLVLLSVQQIINKQQYQSSLNFQVDTNLRMIQSLINNPTAWGFTIAANSGLACAANPSTCRQGDTANVFIVKDSILPSGNVYYDWTGPKGLDKSGTPCTGFVNSPIPGVTGNGNSQCPLQFQIQWTADCSLPPGTLCGISPMTSKIVINTVYNPGPDTVAIPFNTKAKILPFTQGTSGGPACSWQTNSLGLVENCGNVGVGTTSPQANLDVMGTTLLRKVGIGTTSPQADLDVVGTTILRTATGTLGFASGKVLRFYANSGLPLMSYSIESTGAGLGMNVVHRNDMKTTPTSDSWMMNFRLNGSPSSSIPGDWPQYAFGSPNNRIEFFGGINNDKHDSINIAAGGIYFQEKCIAGDPTSSACPHSIFAPYPIPSDERLKDHIRPFVKGLEALNKIKTKLFRFNGLGGSVNDDKDKIGVIAQELEKLLPELVFEEGEKFHKEDKELTMIKKVNYTGLTFVTINAIQDLYKKLFGDSGVIQQLKDENKALTAQVTELKSMFCAEHPRSAACKKK